MIKTDSKNYELREIQDFKNQESGRYAGWIDSRFAL
jgi:hypothetical protein